MTGRLDGRHALITGGASGIGFGVARLFHAEGAAVTLVDTNAALLEDRVADLGPRTRGHAADVTDEDAVSAAVAAAGPLDVAVNAAGAGTFGPVTDLPAADWRRIIDLCLTGVFLSVKHEAPAMGEGGAIINIASLNARQPAAGMSAYCAAKAGVEMFTKVAAMELGPSGIRVNALAPGLVETPLTTAFTEGPLLGEFVDNAPLGRIGQPGDIAAAALFLATEQSAWVTGELLLVDGGAHTMRYPKLMHRGEGSGDATRG
ncbi:MAG TPA: SDR family NAD(P)-dependent oxidoreductase [Streptosporangiaceae bacterium]|jgi:NAD(P)-dependent dehydrogenase (short-subunit alcohol dehydrogenase family)